MLKSYLVYFDEVFRKVVIICYLREGFIVLINIYLYKLSGRDFLKVLGLYI